MTDDAWRAKWGTLTRDQAEQVVAQCQASHDAQKACEHCWHSHGVVYRQAIAGGATEGRVTCCHCGANATAHQRYEEYQPEWHGKWHPVSYRALPATYAIEYTTVPTIDP